MKRVIEITSKLIFPEYGRYARIVASNKLKRLINRDIANKYLFILSPSFCGSTLLNELISTSPYVSVNNPFGTREGQTLPTIRKIMFDHTRRWDESLDFDWEYLKEEWREYWDTNKAVLLEKSPPNIIRAASIKKAFPNSFFIILYRNPYAHCEGFIRRYGNPKSAAEFAIKCLAYQRKNQLLSLNSISISYEDLTSKPEKIKDQIISFIPEIKDIKSDIKFSAQNFKNKKMAIKNLNKEKINKLSQAQLNEINEVFYKNKELLQFFDYELIRKHADNK
ncbi:MAG: sulfotransferase [Saprospiraceae bacterium]